MGRGRLGAGSEEVALKERRVWWPFLQCERSYKFLFLKKAYYGRYYVDWELEREVWLSAEEFMLAALKEEFNER